MIDDTALARLARQYSKEAIAALVFAIRNSTDVRVRVTAALGLLERGYGKPAQAKLPAVAISPEDLDGMIAHLELEPASRSGTSDPATAPTSDGDADPNAIEPVLAIFIAEAAPRASEGLSGPSPDAG